jgi:hypothetical protein
MKALNLRVGEAYQNAAIPEMKALNLRVGEAYQNAAIPVIEEQIAKAGYRLAAILNALFPG